MFTAQSFAETQSNQVLARLLAEENLSVKFANVPTASFTVHSRVLTLPMLQTSQLIINWHIAHEVGHALYTPELYTELSSVPYMGAIPNIVEDFRINNKICARYPGFKHIKAAAYKALYYQGFFDGNEKYSEMSFLNRLNVHNKIPHCVSIEFTAEEMQYVELAQAAETWEQVVSACHEIKDWLLRKQEEEKESELSAAAPNFDDDEDNDDDDDDYQNEVVSTPTPDPEPDTPEEEDSDDGGEPEPDPEPETSGMDSEEEPESSDPDPEEEPETSGMEPATEPEASPDPDEPAEEEDDSIDSPASGGDSGESGESDESDTDEPTEQDTDDNKESKYSTFAKTVEEEESWYRGHAQLEDDGNSYVSVPKIADWKEWIVNKKRFLELLESDFMPTSMVLESKEIGKFLKSNKTIIEEAAQVFEMNREIQYSAPEMVDQMGVLDPNRLHAYQFDDQVFLRDIVSKTNATNHGLMLFVDFSQSMEFRIHGCLQQALNLVYFARAVGIPYQVYGFTHFYRSYQTPNQYPDYETGYAKMVRADVPVLFELFNDDDTQADTTKSADMLLMYAKGLFDWQQRKEYPSWCKSRSLMHSTPTDMVLHLAKYIGEDMISRHGIQKLQTIFITDGASDAAVYDRDSDFHVFDEKAGVTKTTNRRHFTKMMSENLTDYLDTRITNFYVAEKNDFKSKRKMLEGLDGAQVIVDKVIVMVPNVLGFPENYIIREDRFTVPPVKIELHDTKRKAAASFAKRMRSQKSTRIMMNSFAEMIA